MFICPNCRTEILRHRGPSGFFLYCPECKGRSATLSLLRRYIPRPVINSIWHMGQSRHFAHKRDCPCCNHKMTEVPVADHASADLVDVCARCQLVWFDHFEYDNLPKISEAKTTEAAPAAINTSKQADKAKAFGLDRPDTAWQWIPGFFGMPIEHEEQRFNNDPWVTWGLAILMVLTALLTIGRLDVAIYDFGLRPSEFERYGGLTFITSFFLHGGVMHLLGNLYFLLVFGDNVEEELGKWSYALFILAATLFGDFAHILGTPNDKAHLIGASGGISGIIAYYALKFPHARLGFMFHAYVVFKWFRFPAYALFIGWILIQLFLLWQQLNGYGNISALGHLGGAATGVVLWALGKLRNHQYA